MLSRHLHFTRPTTYTAFTSALGIGLVAIGSVLVISSSGESSLGTSPLPTSLAQVVASSKRPLLVSPVRSASYHTSTDRVAMRSRLAPSEGSQVTLPYAIHLLKLHGVSKDFNNTSVPATSLLLTALTDERAGKQLFGGSPLRRTAQGLRYVDQPRVRGRSAESHRDLCLATFAELGLPLSHPIHLANDETCSVRDVLQDSLLNFHVAQRELEWTAVALALYLPPITQWTNRYGERCTFDELSSALMQKPLDDTPCAGTHILQAITTISRVDEEHIILSPEIRRNVSEYLRRRLADAVAAQEPDGSWCFNWFAPPGSTGEGRPGHWSPPPSVSNRLVATGHLIEWMHMLPRSFDVPQSALSRACRWLEQRVLSAAQPEMEASFCAYTHALIALYGRGHPESCEKPTADVLDEDFVSVVH